MRIWPEKTVDQEFADLGAVGWFGTLNDRQFAYLRNAGYTGGLADMMFQLRTAPVVPAFTPASIFTGTDTGFWADVTPSRLWQDVARTTPVTAAGQSVASWELTTRTGVIYAEQPTAGNRPTYEVDVNGRGFLLGNGTSRHLIISSLTLGPNYQAFAAYHALSIAATQHIMDSDFTGARRNAQLLRIAGPSGAPETISFSGTTPISDGNAGISVGANNVLSAIARSAIDVDVRANGTSNGATTSSLTFNTFTDQVMIGRWTGSASGFFNGRIYGLVLRSGPNLTSTQITDTEAWLANLMVP